MLRGCAAVVVAASATWTPAQAEEGSGASRTQESAAAGGVELWTSTDSDKTDVVKLLGRALLDFEGRDKFYGIAVERAWFRPLGQHVRKQTRAYLDLADGLGRNLRWQARIGTDGHTVLGSADLRTADWSKEMFVEREIVETPHGLDHGIYYTFFGASTDVQAGERSTVNLMTGVQDFTGRNVRLHLRANYVRVVAPRLGISLQLRARYFHSTVPGEFDYYSPRNFVQLVPVIQMRRFDGAGWMYLVALGEGAQKGSGSRWESARLADLRIQSPARSAKLQAFAQLQYSNNSLTGGAGHYHYVVARVGLTTRLH
jgi:hypothetical protein